MKQVAANLLRLLGVLILSIGFQGVGSAQIPGQPANSYVMGSSWYCVNGYEKVGSQCLSIFRNMGGQPANSYVMGSSWYCVNGYEKVGSQCRSIFARSQQAASSSNSSAGQPSSPSSAAPACAENGSCYGDISDNTGRPKTIHVDGYYRKDGTYVRGHYRSSPRSK